jgi:hypothetical protein
MKVSTVQKRFLVIASLVAFHFGGFYHAHAQNEVDDNFRADERKLSDELEQDKSFLQVGCTLTFTEEFGPNYLEARDEDNRIRLSLYAAVRSRKGIVKAKQICPKREGDTFVDYLIVEQGEIKLVKDYSRGSFGSLRVYSYTCGKLVLGSFELLEGNRFPAFQPIADENIPAAKSKTTLTLQCEIGNDRNYKITSPF